MLSYLALPSMKRLQQLRYLWSFRRYPAQRALIFRSVRSASESTIRLLLRLRPVRGGFTLHSCCQFTVSRSTTYSTGYFSCSSTGRLAPILALKDTFALQGPLRDDFLIVNSRRWPRRLGLVGFDSLTETRMVLSPTASQSRDGFLLSWDRWRLRQRVGFSVVVLSALTDEKSLRVSRSTFQWIPYRRTRAGPAASSAC